jgi:hypothetical protein
MIFGDQFMKTTGKAVILLTAVSLMITVSVSVSALSFTDLQGDIDEFSEAMAKVLPFNSTIGLNWSDAYIGQLISAPPHFGVGVSVGATTVNLSSIANILDYFGQDLGAFGLKGAIGDGGMVLPAYTAEARIGGFILPFDIGVKVGYLPKMEGLGDLDYLLVGGEIRYAILKGSVILPKLSVGLGVNYMHGGIGMNIGGGTTEFDIGNKTLAIQDPHMNFTWESTSIDLKAQVSKSFLIITPYLGLGASWAASKVGYELNSKITYGGTALDQAGVDAINTALNAADKPTIDRNGGGFSSYKENPNGWSLRAFGGLSINMAVIRLDLTGMINFLDLNNYAAFGATLGVRFQL